MKTKFLFIIFSMMSCICFADEVKQKLQSTRSALPSSTAKLEINKHLLLTDGSQINSESTQFSLLMMPNVGAPVIAIKNRHNNAIHYLMTEVYSGISKKNFCTGKMISKKVCLLKPFSNSTVLAKISDRTKNKQNKMVHTVLIDRNVASDEKELKSLTQLMESIR